MNNTQRKKQAADKNEDWAIIPFDEAEDDARWQQLIDETEELITEAQSLSTQYGVKLTPNRLSDLKVSKSADDETLF